MYLDDLLSLYRMQDSFLIAGFNDCDLGKSGQTANPIFAKVDPILYYIVYMYIYACESVKREHRKNS